jgi:hypothetical protein
LFYLVYNCRTENCCTCWSTWTNNECRH